MVLIKQVTGNLIGGVSTLAEAHRQPNQTQSQTNAEPSIREGLRKRAKTTYKGSFATNPTNAKFHSIFQDGVEEYVLAATTDSVQAMDAQTGTNLGVYKLTRNTGGSITGGTLVTSTDLAYLSNSAPSGTSPFTTPDPEKDFEFLTLGDTTLVLNRKVLTDEQSVSGTVPDTLNWAYVFIKQLASPDTKAASQMVLEFSRVATSGTAQADARIPVPQAAVPGGGQFDLDKQHVRADIMLSSLRERIEGNSSLNFSGLFDDMYFPGDDGQDIPTSNQTFEYHSSNTATWPIMDTYVLPLAIDGSVHSIPESITDIKVHYTGGDSLVSAFVDRVAYIDDLPTVCHNGKTVRVLGNPASDQDDYYVTFRATEGYFREGVWEETKAQPWIEVGPNPAKMPHLLIRRQDDVNGTVTGTASAIYFEYAALDGTVSDINGGDPWGGRRCGDSTQPLPAFLGDLGKGIRKSIQDMFFYNNRLGFITKDGDISMSEAGNYFQFYRKSVNTLLDTDPIHATISGATTSEFEYALPFSRELLILGNNAQYSLNNAGGITSPRTITIDRISGYEMSKQARPVVLENTAVFASSGTNHNQVWQMYRQDDVSYAASETTEAVPGYIQGPALGLTASSVTGMIAVATDTGRLFCHNYFRQGSQLLQQAWWELVPANIGKVRFAQFVGDTIRIVAEKKTSPDASTSELVVIDYEPDNADEFHTDYVTQGTLSGTYNSTTDQTTITLPYGSTSDDAVSVYNLTESRYEDVASVTPGASTTTVYVEGDVAGDTLKVGLDFDFIVGLHSPVLAIRNTSRTQSPERSRRILVNKMDLTYTDTLPFNVEVDSQYRDTRVFRRPYNIIGDLGAKSNTPDPQSGVLEVGLHLPQDDLEITIKDTGPTPIKLENIQWEMNYRPIARTWAGR